MCGIAGIVDFTDKRPDEHMLLRMLGAINHRGPDACGIYLENTVGLGSVRLSIIDLSGGDQPIHNEDRSIWIVYNGEVFNYVELRPDLERKGHRFYTNTDTEVLVHLYEEKGPEMLRDLNGQFALALWDKNERSLFIARDRMGIRPLFYVWNERHLSFASEIKALFVDPGIKRSLNLQTLSDTFICWSPLGDATPFEGVSQLMPGHWAVFTQDGLKIDRYWQIPYGDRYDNDRPYCEWKEELTELLLDACRVRLRADVPVGAYLSGGLDSTYTSALVKTFFNNQLCTFSVSFADRHFDESPFQMKAAESLGIDNKMIHCTDRDIGEIFPEVVWHAEAPLLRTAPAPLFQLSKLVRENDFKVVLTGEGSDEIFAGYDIFKEDRIRRFWARQPESKARPKLLRKLYFDIFDHTDAKTVSFLEGFFRKGLSRVQSPAYSHLIRWENTASLKGFFSDELKAEISGTDEFVDRFTSTLPADFMSWDTLSRAQYIESTIFLPNYLLSSQGDRMASAHAVEGRFPFLDYRVVEFAARLPPQYRLRGLKDKFILREVAVDLLPRELACRQKQPYRAPISRSFFGDHRIEYVNDLLSERRIRGSHYFDQGKVRKLVQKIGRRDGQLLSERENMALAGIMSTQLLHDQFIERFPLRLTQEPQTAQMFDYRQS